MTENEPFIPDDMLKSQESIEAWVAVAGHPHITSFSRRLEKLKRVHTVLHLTQPLTCLTPEGEEKWEREHEEVMDEVAQVQTWAVRAKLAIWN